MVGACNKWSHRRRVLRWNLPWVTFAVMVIASSPVSADDIERGKYLVEALTACDNCHTPRGPAGYDESQRFSGGSQTFAGPGYLTRGGNISPDKPSGIGEWTDDELKAAIVKGQGKSGRLAPYMPSDAYTPLSNRDLDAIVAYMRLLPPISTAAKTNEPRPEELRRPALPGAETAFVDDALRDPKTRGLYIASLARCMACHSGENNDIPDYATRLGVGGKVFRTPAGVAVASNISSHPEKGIGAWTDAEVKRAIVDGVSRDGRTLKPTMANLSKAHFKKMTGDDLDALVVWLRTIPPKE